MLFILTIYQDSEVAFVGGINLDFGELTTPEHYPRKKGFNNIHDIYAQIRGPAATDVIHSFVQRWGIIQQSLTMYSRIFHS